MNGVPVHILLVEDNVAEARLLQKMLTEPGGEFEVTHVETLTEALEQLQHRVFEAALVDLSLPDSRGLGTVEHLVAAASQLPIVVLTGLDDEALATEAIRKGAARITWSKGRERIPCSFAPFAMPGLKNAEEALQDADRLKDEFLATLAHELRNPLAPISNALGLLRLAENDVATFRQVRDMVELPDQAPGAPGRRPARRLPHYPRQDRVAQEAPDLAAAVQSAVETSRPHFEARQHELAVLLPETPLYVDGDLTRLCRGPVQPAPQRGQVHPGQRPHCPEHGAEAREVVVRVSDNGLGIPPDMLPRVFEMFAQVDKHLDRAQGGLGIGLSLVRQLVQMHGGTVEASDTAGLGEGSEFPSIRLPLLEEGRPVPQAARSRAANRSSGAGPWPAARLVVDDNRDSAESLAQLVQLLGHEVRTAFDGPSALEVAVAFVPEFVLLDIGMPGMDGYEVALHLRQIPLLRNAVLVAQTGWGQEEDRRRRSRRLGSITIWSSRWIPRSSGQSLAQLQT